MLLFDKIIFLFNKQDVYIGYSIEEVSKVITVNIERWVFYGI